VFNHCGVPKFLSSDLENKVKQTATNTSSSGVALGKE
jgi:hypothetical protein